ncbi:hypothetical protein [Brasilonema sp. UFV-L1]|uniref:hypothetical protein n=1 Tax=Brasilonema sp. UFV-L1 TaxID=2234130 RepID=UPI00145DA5BE|nr:hypothetical protein [Brasilonema sp. UFV-L1]NMG08706.1 hypothetical protein [Brasilonema sp. UFV-L1]
MSSIKISQLRRPVGSELFEDTESFLHELTSEEIREIKGGLIVSVVSESMSIYTQSQIVIPVNDRAIFAEDISLDNKTAALLLEQNIKFI